MKRAALKIASFNINNVNRRLPVLLRWLKAAKPDIVCLQELKAQDADFPEQALKRAGYRAVWRGEKTWNGVAILARGIAPHLTRDRLPGAPEDKQSRYIEAAVDGILVACIYLPNGNPQPGPKFDYKLAWFERLIRHAVTLQKSGHAVVLAGDYNVIPTDFDIYNTRSWLKDALLQPAPRECYRRLLAQGWTDAIRTLYPEERIYTFWDYFRKHWEHNSGLRIDHLLLNETLAPRLVAGGVDTWVRGRPGASDHAPTWVVLNDAPKAKKKPAPKTVRHAKAK